MTARTANPVAPRGLSAAGRRAWRAALSSLPPDTRFTPKELESLRLVAGQAELVDRLERELAAAPSLVVGGAQGQPREHPHVAALSSARAVMARLLAEVRLEVDAAEGLPVRSRRAQRAAQARWRARRELSEQHRQLGGG